MLAQRLSGSIGNMASTTLTRIAFFLVLTIGFATTFTQATAQDYAFSRVVVEGNDRIEPATIVKFAGISRGEQVSAAALNDAFQRLTASGLFASVELVPSGSTLIIRVVENPTINIVSFEGNQKLKDEDLAKLVKSQSRRVYSVSQAEADAAAIVQGYADASRLAARVEPRVIDRGDNRVDLVFEIREGKVTEVERLSFTGNRSFSDRRLRQVLGTKQAGLLRNIIQRDTFVADRIEFDKQLLVDFYRARGFIDFQVLVGDKAVEDAGASDFQVELGGGTLLGPIEEALVGKKAGETAEANVEMPATHPHPKLKGKTATFALTLKALKERVLPAVDDELAKDLGEFDSLEELKKDIRERLEKQAKEASENAVAEQLVVELVKANPIPIPPSLVERQMRLTEQEVLSQARRQGQTGNLGDELRTKIREDSEVKVRAGLLMAEIAKKQEIKIGDPEIEEGLKELADQSGKNVARLRAEYSDPRRREMLVGMILENKVLDIIESKAKIEDEK